MQGHRGPSTRSRTPEEHFGYVLKEVRKARELSQEELAFRSNYHPTYIGQLERGVKSPSLRTIVAISAVLDISMAELLGRVESRMHKKTS